jgi:hypothetical protein
MHGGLYVEMGQFLYVSLSGWAQRDGALKAPGLSVAIPLLFCRQAGFEQWVKWSQRLIDYSP